MYKAVILVTLVAAVNCAFPTSNYFEQQRQLQQQRNRNFYYGGRISPEGGAQILRSESESNPDSFAYSFETSNGIQAQEAGQLRQIGRDAAIVTQGSYSYISPEGEPVSVSYIADENGFQPTGTHIPTPPPIPDAIQRSIDYILRVNGQRPQLRFFPRF